MDTMDVDMDLDVDFAPNEPVTEAQDTPSPGEVIDTNDTSQPDTQTLQPNKIHVRGLDVLNTDEVKSYVKEHFPDSAFDRIEWIDDTSANLIFRSESIAQEALVALTSVQIGDVTQLPLLEFLPAKPFSLKTGVNLQIRFAVVADKKESGAAQKSRFYLLNPEYDPENRPRRDNRKYRDRDGEGHTRRQPRSRVDEPIDHFDVNLYDDDATALATRAPDSRPRRRRSYSPVSDRIDPQETSSYREANRSKELFPDGSVGRSRPRRDRSASPGRDRNGDLDMDHHSSDGSAARNRRGARAIKDRLSESNRSKELFPGNASTSAINRLDDVTELSSRFTLQSVDGSGDVPPPRSRKLGDRVTAPGNGGRLADRITEPVNSSSFSIRGSARSKGTQQGFAIKGGANKSAKELFPDQFGSNAGKELFADKADGRSRPRQKAGDLFD